MKPPSPKPPRLDSPTSRGRAGSHAAVAPAITQRVAPCKARGSPRAHLSGSPGRPTRPSHPAVPEGGLTRRFMRRFHPAVSRGSQEKGVAKSKYVEDVLGHNHSAIWGSYFDKRAFRWGYADDHSTTLNS